MKPQVISFHYTLKDKSGKQIESSHSGDPVICLEGGGQIIPALEKVLVGLKVGDKKEVPLKAAEAYGQHDKNLIIDVPKDQLPKGKEALKVGHQFQSQAPEGGIQLFTVKAVTDSHATLDGNHPLAGQDLTFNIEVTEKREATKEELEHGHVHGPDGHHHH
jgi:FKBP-type peptidyl-prolyl cis-trans isomerase SlyD